MVTGGHGHDLQQWQIDADKNDQSYSQNFPSLAS
jgi:hypothetical protein